MFESLGGVLTARAGGGGIVVPGGVGADVALPRSHLVEPAGGELVEPHKRVGFQRGSIWISGWVGRGPDPFFHEEVLAPKVERGVGAARGGLGVEFA